MQLSFDAADRLVELVHARRARLPPEDAARVLFALERAPATLARCLLADVVDGDARLTWLGTRVGLAGDAGRETAIENAELVVFDLETTGLSASRARDVRDRRRPGSRRSESTRRSRRWSTPESVSRRRSPR